MGFLLPYLDRRLHFLSVHTERMAIRYEIDGTDVLSAWTIRRLSEFEDSIVCFGHFGSRCSHSEVSPYLSKFGAPLGGFHTLPTSTLIA